MIKLIYPASSFGGVVKLDSWLVPISIPFSDVTLSSIEQRSEFDYLNQGSHARTESDVDNLQMFGDVTFHSDQVGFVSNPLTGYPNNGYYGGSTPLIQATWGAVDGSVHHTGPFAGERAVGIGFRSVNGFTSKYATYNESTPTTCKVIKETVFSNCRITNNVFYYDYEIRLQSVYKPIGIDLSLIDFSGLQSLSIKTPSITRRSGSATIGFFEKPLSPPTLQQMMDTVRAIFSADLFLKSEINFPLIDKSYGDIAMQAGKNLHANKVNMWEFLGTWENPLSMIEKLSNLKNLKSLKGLSDNYLTAHFGLLPTVDDINSMISSAKKYVSGTRVNSTRFAKSSFSQSKQEGIYTYLLDQHCKLAVDPWDDPFRRILSGVNSLGTLPTLSRLWDLVPFSFAIDWFVDVGNYLERTEFGTYQDMLNIRYATWSRKSTVSIANGMSNLFFPTTVNLQLVHYRRWTSDLCPVPSISSPEVQTDFNHWLESGALFIQRFHH